MTRPSTPKTGPTPKRTRVGQMPKMRSPYRQAVARSGQAKVHHVARVVGATFAPVHSLSKRQRLVRSAIEEYEAQMDAEDAAEAAEGSA